MVKFSDIKQQIISDDKMAIAIEYMFSKAIREGMSHCIKFIYKRHKVIRDKNGYYSIYRLDDGRKIYGKIKWQDVAKYIIDNLNNCCKIDNIIKAQNEILRYQDKINFMKQMYSHTNNKDLIEAKISMDYVLYNQKKRELFSIIGKDMIC